MTISATSTVILGNFEKFTNADEVTEIKDDEGIGTGNYKVVDENKKDCTGILDTLLKTSTLHLDVQFKSGRIRQEEYAQALVQLYQMNLQAAVQIYLQTDTEKEKMLTYERQRKGYDEDYMVKATSMLLDSYVAFLTSMPNTPNQPYPSMFTGFYNLDDSYEKPMSADDVDFWSPNNPKFKGWEQKDIDKYKESLNNGDTEWKAPIKLQAIDGLMGRHYTRIANYQNGINPPPTSKPNEKA